MRRRGKRRVSEWSDCVRVSVSEEARQEEEEEGRTGCTQNENPHIEE